MYQAILIDDEETVRNGLRDHFDWAFHGLKLVQTFPDCQEAYAYIRQNPVDIVVTDVVTPHMDGITMAKLLQQEFPNVRIIFISGHADVRFLKEALKTEAFDYILKAVDLDELSAAVKRVTSSLDCSRQRDQRLKEMDEVLRELIPINRERVLQSLLIDANDIVCAPYLGINLDLMQKYVCLVLHLINKWSTSKSMTGPERLALSADCDRLCNEVIEAFPNSLCFKSQRSEWVLMLGCSFTDYEQDVLELSGSLKKAFLAQLGLECAVGISEPMFPAQLSAAYAQAREALEQGYYLDAESTIAVAKYPEILDTKSARETVEKQIPNALLSADPAQLNSLLSHLFAYKRTTRGSEQDNFMLFLLLTPPRVITTLRVREDSPYRDQRMVINHWLGCSSDTEQERFIKQIMHESLEMLRDTNELSTASIVRQVKATIDRCYMEQLSVSSLASQVHLTPTYLCVVFKQETGITINDYLTAERLRQAKRLLSDPNVKLADVCFEVGYLSPSYFSKLFKKQVGVPPGEYRSKVLQGEHSGWEGDANG